MSEMSSPAALELDAAALRELVDQVMRRLGPLLDGIPDAPMSCDEGALPRDLVEIPEVGRVPDEVLDVVFSHVLRDGLAATSPGYMGYVPGGGLVHAGVAELITAVANRYVGLWSTAPGVVQLEAGVVRWMADLLGFGPRAGGVLTTGGSMATFTALFTARREKLGDDLSGGLVYTSDQAHQSVQRAAMLVGIPTCQVRVVPSTSAGPIDVAALRAQICRDEARGLRPFVLVGHGGTTNTGAVDPLGDLADIAAAHGLWFHVDAAYGGFFLLTARGRQALAGIERADSVTLDPHKGLFLPYGTGAVVVRDRGALRRAHHVDAAYLPPMPDDGRVDFCTMSPELSRDVRGLRVWLPLALHGVATFRAYLNEKLDLAQHAHEVLRGLEDVEVVAAPELSLVAFRHVPSHVDASELDAWNRAWLERVNAGDRVFLSGTMFRGRFVLRMCVLCFRTHRARVDEALAHIRSTMT
jgi:aromatic-L-amino-acid decarboxylase